jgi:hypothetical protein
MVSSNLNSDMKRDIITRDATILGIKYGSAAALVTGASVYLANERSTWFRHRLGISGKVGLVVMAGLGMFTLSAELTVAKGMKNPAQYIADRNLERNLSQLKEPMTESSSTHLKWYHHVANSIYDHPFKSLAITAVPAVGLIFLGQSRNDHILMSQKIMHTRIYGQSACVVLLLSTMAFQDYMSKRGRFQ